MGIGYVDIYNGIIIAMGIMISNGRDIHFLHSHFYHIFTIGIIRGRCLHKFNRHNSTSRIYMSFSLPRSDFNNILHHRTDIYLREDLNRKLSPPGGISWMPNLKFV